MALGDALEKYEGTAFVVTHDRDLVNSFATRIFAFTESGLVDWRGSYEDFAERYDNTKKNQDRDQASAAG